MPFELRRVTCLIGPFGSGKTELSIGLALQAARLLDSKSGAAPSAARGRVLLADLDVLKPYFRSRDVKSPLDDAGVRVLAPAGALAQSDLPVIPAEVRGAIVRQDMQIILDVGGDPVGARALGSLSDVIARAPHDVLLVLNRNRPFMDSSAGVIAYAREIERASQLAITGVLSNTHMLDETTLDEISWGLELARDVAAALNVGVRGVGVPSALAGLLAGRDDLPPLMAIDRQMKPDFLGGIVLASNPSRTLRQGEPHASARNRS